MVKVNVPCGRFSENFLNVARDKAAACWTKLKVCTARNTNCKLHDSHVKDMYKSRLVVSNFGRYNSKSMSKLLFVAGQSPHMVSTPHMTCTHGHYLGERSAPKPVKNNYLGCCTGCLHSGWRALVFITRQRAGIDRVQKQLIKLNYLLLSNYMERYPFIAHDRLIKY